jgi:thiol-disulfide isomerase/thioredoxin
MEDSPVLEPTADDVIAEVEVEQATGLVVEPTEPQAPEPSKTPTWAWALIGLGVLILAGQVVLGLLIQQRSGSLDDAVAAEGQRLDGVDARIDRLGDVLGRVGLQLEEIEAASVRGSVSAAPTATGTPAGGLPPIPQGGADPAIGMTLGSFTAHDWTADADLTVGPSERAKVILVWAHWCPYCQQEMPILEGLYSSGALDEFTAVDFLTITTFIDESRPNPLEPYLEDQAFGFPVLVDGDSSLAAALGVQAVPAWVIIGADGAILGRFTGAIPEQQVLGVFGEVQRIQTGG